METPRYSIIMPVLLRTPEHKTVVEDTINSIKEFSRNYEFIIVDDGSPLFTGFLKSAATTYVRHNSNNWGIASSWNDGLRLARGQYLVVINDDIRVEKGWLKRLSDVLDAGHVVSAPINGWQEGMEFYKWFPGYCFMFRQSLLSRVGYFDERFNPANCEDVDYWFRVMKEGGTLGRAFDLRIYHKEGDVLHYMGYEKLSQKAIAKFINKHGFDPQPYFYGDKSIQEKLKGGEG